MAAASIVMTNHGPSDASKTLARDNHEHLLGDLPKFKYCYYNGFANIEDPEGKLGMTLMQLLKGIPAWFPLCEHQAVRVRSDQPSIKVMDPPGGFHTVYELTYKGMYGGVVRAYRKETNKGNSRIEGLVALVIEDPRQQWAVSAHWGIGFAGKVLVSLAPSFEEMHGIDVDANASIQDVIDQLKGDKLLKWSSHYFYSARLRSTGVLRGFETRKSFYKLIEH
jgi:hypothetical protein